MKTLLKIKEKDDDHSDIRMIIEESNRKQIILSVARHSYPVYFCVEPDEIGRKQVEKICEVLLNWLEKQQPNTERSSDVVNIETKEDIYEHFGKPMEENLDACFDVAMRRKLNQGDTNPNIVKVDTEVKSNKPILKEKFYSTEYPNFSTEYPNFLDASSNYSLTDYDYPD